MDVLYKSVVKAGQCQENGGSVGGHSGMSKEDFRMCGVQKC